uniref:Uncharacterized protein n=2 Tax=Timema TaxID=61471 RepID=A0A7R9AZJ0_TIMSH|nr:unnamed protein product [Timema shepardi]CAD7575413.1 unnamed protein product [Timema californicum]
MSSTSSLVDLPELEQNTAPNSIPPSPPQDADTPPPESSRLQCPSHLLTPLSSSDTMFDDIASYHASAASTELLLPFSESLLEPFTGSTSFKEADGKASLLPEFSREHRTAMEDIYSSLQEDLISLELVEEYLCRDTPTSEQPFAPSLSSTTLEEITVLLMDRSLRLTPQSLEETLEEIGEEKEEAKQQQPSKVPARRAESDSSDGSAGDAMEGLWRMLSAYDEFRLTQPGYDAFDQDEPHWLDQDLMPWELVEESRKKCLEWFERNKRVDV